MRLCVVLVAAVLVTAAPVCAQLRTGELLVASDPPGARVILDGNEMDEGTPFGPAEIPAGMHTIELRLRNLPSERRMVTVEAGQTTRVMVSFLPRPGPQPAPPQSPPLPTPPPPARTPAVGALQIESEPVGATVIINGTAHGQTPIEVSALQEGSYELRLELPGYAPHLGTVSIKGGEVVRTTARLAFLPGGSGGAGGGTGGSRPPSGALAVLFAMLLVTGTGAAALIVVVKRRRAAVTVVMQPTPSRGVPVQGTILFGDYQVVEKIASGGMANIYKALDRRSRQPAVLKVPYEQFQSDKTFIERFRREGELAKKLHNENIIKMYEAGTTSEGLTYIAMEYIAGMDLRHAMAGGLTLEAVVDVVVHVCRGLDYCHSKQIVHRDIKPENVMIATGPPRRAVLMDFGIARAGYLGTIGTGSTYLGTPYYMAPEPANGCEPGPASDLYSVGVMLFEMLTGRRPFDDDNPVMVLQHHVSTPPPSPRSINSKVPAELESIVLKLLAKRPEGRFQSAEEVIVALQDFARRHVAT